MTVVQLHAAGVGVEYSLSFLKWDHNRDLIDAGHSPTGRAGVHEQTGAVYRLLDELRRMRAWLHRGGWSGWTIRIPPCGYTGSSPRIGTRRCSPW